MPNTIADARVMARAVAPWPPEEAASLQRMARQESTHDHKDLSRIRDRDERDMTRDNCQACCLEAKKSRKEPPNVGNWLRTYIQTGRSMPNAWYQEVMDHAEVHGTAWYNAVLRDIRTFGIREFVRPGHVIES